MQYKHGGDILSFAKEIRCSVDEVIDFSSNINFVKPNVRFDNIDLEPYPNYTTLYQKVAKFYNINQNNIEFFNGASSAIYEFFRFINNQYVTIYSPAYLEYKKIATLLDKKIDTINRFTNIDRGVKNNALVVFVNPSTPDGTYYDIEPFLKAWDSLGCDILVDESFLDFVPNGNSAIRYMEKYKKLYILKSFTKFFGSAGIRIGAIISNQNNIANLSKIQPPWKISALDQAYLIQALQDKDFLHISKGLNITNLAKLEQILKKSNLFEYIYNSNANFILAKLKNIDAFQLQNKLSNGKILIRNCFNFDYLNKYYVRFSVNKIQDIQILEKFLCE